MLSSTPSSARLPLQESEYLDIDKVDTGRYSPLMPRLESFDISQAESLQLAICVDDWLYDRASTLKREIFACMATCRDSNRTKVHIGMAESSLYTVDLRVIKLKDIVETKDQVAGYILPCYLHDAKAAQRLDKMQIEVEKAKGESFPAVVMAMITDPAAVRTFSENDELVLRNELQAMAELYCLGSKQAILGNKTEVAGVIRSLVLLCHWHKNSVDIVTPDLALMSHEERIKHKYEEQQAATQQLMKQPLPPTFVRQGWLNKQTAGKSTFARKAWKRRWFCLEANVLSFQKTPDSHPLGVINLSLATKILLRQHPSVASRKLIDITLPEDVIVLHADDPVDTRAWLTVISLAAGVHSTDTALSKPSKSTPAQLVRKPTRAQLIQPFDIPTGAVSLEHRQALLLAHAQSMQALTAPDALSLEDLSKVLAGNLRTPSVNVRRHVRLLLYGGSDMMQEKEILHREVLPFVKTFANALGLNLSVVDPFKHLKTSALQDTVMMEQVKHELLKCQKESAATSLLLLLGDAPGDFLLPETILEGDFKMLRAGVVKAHPDRARVELALLDKWYKRNDNEIPCVFRLAPTHHYLATNAPKPKASEMAWSAWDDERLALRSIIQLGLNAIKGTELGILRDMCPISEQLAERGIADEDCSAGFLFVKRHFQKTPSASASDKALSDFTCIGDKVAETKLQRMVERVHALLPVERRMQFDVPWAPAAGLSAKLHGKYFDRFASNVSERLTNDLLTHYCRTSEDVLLYELEQHRQLSLQAIATTGFTRPEIMQQLTDYLLFHTTSRRKQSGQVDDDTDVDDATAVHRRPLVLSGEGGSGKSWLLAHSIKVVQDTMPSAVIAARYIGCTDEIHTPRRLLFSLCQQIERAYHLDNTGSDTSPRVPTQMDSLVAHFHKCLQYSSMDRPLLVVLDGLDKINYGNAVHNFHWLHVSKALPPYTRILVSTSPFTSVLDINGVPTPFNLLQELRQYLTQDESIADIGSLDSGVLTTQSVNVLMKELYNRSLMPDQAHSIVQAFEMNRSPLMLRLLLRYATVWQSTTPFGEGPAVVTELESYAEAEMFALILEELEEKHGVLLVKSAMCLLSLAEYGLSYDDMLQLLSKDRRLLAPQVLTVEHNGEFPPLAWLRLYRDIESLVFICDSRYGAPKMLFTHSLFVETVQTLYLASESERITFHTVLADHFAGIIAPFMDIAWSSDGHQRRMTMVTSAAPEGLLRGSSGVSLVSDSGRKAISSSSSSPSKHKNRSPRAQNIKQIFHALRSIIHHLISSNQPVDAINLMSSVEFLSCIVRCRVVFPTLRQMEHLIRNHNATCLIEVYSFLSTLAPFFEVHPECQLQQQLCLPGIRSPRLERALLRDGGQTIKMLSKLHTLFAGKCWQETRHPFANANADTDPLLMETVSLRHQGASRYTFVTGTPYVAAVGRKEIVIQEPGQAKTFSFKNGAHTFFSVASIGREGYIVIGADKGKLFLYNAIKRKVEATSQVGMRVGDVIQVHPSHDGTRIAAVCSSGTMYLWTPALGSDQESTTKALGGHPDVINYAEFAPTGSTLASCCRGGLIILWNARNGQEKRRLKGHTGSVEMLSFHPSGLYLVSGSDDNAVAVWDVRTGKMLQQLTGHSAPVTYCSFCPTDQTTRAISASTDGALWLWSSIGYPHSDADGVGHDVDDASTDQGSLSLQDRALQLYFNSGGLTHTIEKVAFSPCGTLVAATNNNCLCIWRADTGKQVFMLPGQWSYWEFREETNQIFIMSSVEQEATILNLAEILTSTLAVRQENAGAVLNGMAPPLEDTGILEEAAVLSLDLHVERQIAASSKDRGFLSLWNTMESCITYNRVAHMLDINSVCFLPDGKRMLTCSDDSTAIVWEVDTGVKLHEFRGHDGSVNCGTCRNDGRLCVTGGSDGRICIWDVSKGCLRRAIDLHKEAVNSCVFSPRGDQILTSSNDGTCIVYDLLENKIVHVLNDHKGFVKEASYSKFTKYIASCSTDRTLVVYDALSGSKIQTLVGHTAAIVSCKFTMAGDGKNVLVSASKDGTVKLWDVTTGETTRTIVPTGAPLTSLAIQESPDTRAIHAAVGDMTGRIMHLIEIK
eukprot:m.316431 g.316431  ORF g.316431 m.316431 type:complete len:2085 (+) comp15983_c1_seq4:544-6798(+)